jgi:hypothetical protein
MGRQTAWGLDDLVPLMPQVRPVLATMQPGAVVEVQISSPAIQPVPEGTRDTEKQMCFIFPNPFADLSIIVQQASANMMYLAKSSRRVTQITECIDARWRRQYPDIDEDLQ